MSIIVNPKVADTEQEITTSTIAGTGVANTVINVLNLTLESGKYMMGYNLQLSNIGTFTLGSYVTVGDVTPLVLTGSNDPEVASSALSKFTFISTYNTVSPSAIVTVASRTTYYLAISVNSNTTANLLDWDPSAATLPSPSSFYAVKL